MTKAELRTRLLALRRALGPAERVAHGHAVAERVFAQAAWQRAQVVACYLSLPDEVPTQELIQAAWKSGKRLAAPVTHLAQGVLTFHYFHSPEELRSGPMGIPQPGGEAVALETIDLMLVPGLGFDLQGNRLGYGGGFFDRVLDAYSGPSFGLAFEVQILDALPVAPHDRAVLRVLTERRVLPPES